MIVDTSAVLAVLKAEAGWEEIDRIASAATVLRMSAGTQVELGIVVDRLGSPTLSRHVDQLLTVWGVGIESVTPEQAVIARAAYRDFSRGSGHPARLNFGDCFAYALASERAEPLLFVGRDFSETDLSSAIEPFPVLRGDPEHPVTDAAVQANRDES